MDEDTEVWFEALSGRAAEDRRGAAREAHALRAAMLRQRAPDTAPARARDASREAALLERARRAGLIPPRRRSRPFTWERLGSWPALGLYTALACSVLVAAILWRSPRPAEVVRGAPEKIVTLRASDPIALKRALLGELRAAGVKARGYERLGVEGIDADLPVPVPARVRAVLDRHHIATPADATLRVEIVSTAP
ncbi:MAG TPA: hypothetical protein VN730_14800 [Steroidobacteraceae bacterium]|nr:hypothetical protein [Steroidobacteraceae bacterium]